MSIGRIFVVTLLFFSQSISAETTTSQLIKQLNDTGKYLEALSLAQENLFTDAGDEDFDFQMAVAAYELGDTDTAIFTLERLLWTNPDNQQARLYLAKAYQKANALIPALEEITLLGDLALPKEIAVEAQSLHDDLTISIVESKGTLLTGELALTYGYDDNPAASSTATHSSFNQFEFKSRFIKPLSLNARLFSDFQVNGNFYNDLSAKNRQGSLFKFGGDITFDDYTFKSYLQTQHERLNDSAYRNHHTVGIELTHKYSDNTSASTFARHKDTVDLSSSNYDAKTNEIGVSFVHSISNIDAIIISGAYLGQVTPDTSNATTQGDVEKDQLSAYVGGLIKISPSLTYQTVLFTQRNDYAATWDDGNSNTRNSAIRKDDLKSLKHQLTWNLAPSHDVRFEYLNLDNDSNDSYLSYDREIFSLSYIHRFGGNL